MVKIRVRMKPSPAPGTKWLNGQDSYRAGGIAFSREFMEVEPETFEDEDKYTRIFRKPCLIIEVPDDFEMPIPEKEVTASIVRQGPPMPKEEPVEEPEAEPEKAEEVPDKQPEEKEQGNEAEVDKNVAEEPEAPKAIDYICTKCSKKKKKKITHKHKSKRGKEHAEYAE